MLFNPSLLFSGYFSSLLLFRELGFEGLVKTDRFIIAAKARAKAALHEVFSRFAALERVMWVN